MIVEIPFKVSQENGLFQFLHIKAVSAFRAISDSSLQLQVYLTLTRRLSAGLDCYALLPYSPDVAERWPHYIPAHYRYQLLADDFDGLGIDNGFKRLKDGSPLMVMSSIKDVMMLRSLPEDALGEKSSDVTFFFLHPDREHLLKEVLQGQDLPDLGKFLVKNEFFLHLTCGKEQGYYDAMLLHALSDLTSRIKGAIQLTQNSGLL